MNFREFVQGVDREKLEKEIMSSPKFIDLYRDAVSAARLYVESEILMDMYEKEKGDTVNLCGALKAWREKDLTRGRAEGRAEERSLFSKLTLKLNEDGRLTDLVKAALDSEYQQELLREYNLY